MAVDSKYIVTIFVGDEKVIKKLLNIDKKNITALQNYQPNKKYSEIVWDNPGSCFGDEDHFELEKYFSDEELEPMMEYDEPDELMDVTEGLVKDHVENFYVVGCIKFFTVKDADGNIIGECKPDYQGYSL